MSESTDIWQLVLDNPSTPDSLKDEARINLGIKTCTETAFRYDSNLDDVVRGQWGRRVSEYESVDPNAHRAYCALVRVIVLGGVQEEIAEDARILLAAFRGTRSAWVRQKAARALLVARIWYAQQLPTALSKELEAALSEADDKDLKSDESADYLSLLLRQNENKNSDHPAVVPASAS